MQIDPPGALPSGVVGQVWRDGRIQVTLARFLRIDEVEIIPLDEQLARACGELCGATDTRDMVVILARERGDHIVTSHPYALRRLDPTCPIACTNRLLLASDSDDSHVAARGPHEPFYVVRIACENRSFPPKGCRHHNGVNDICRPGHA